MLIALELNLLKRFDESNVISLFVLDYIRTPSRHLESKDFLKIKVILNIAYNYHGLDDDVNALKYSNIGINYCLQKKTFYLLHSLYYRKAVASYYLEKPQNEYMNLFKHSIFLLNMQQMETLRKSYIQITYEKYNLKIDE